MAEMKIHFESDLDFQQDAIKAVTGIFAGQEICRTEFTVTIPESGDQAALELGDSSLGVGNRLQLLDDELLKNVAEIQLRNGLRPADDLQSGDFTVEMETGTGKTYVYLRTIFELNKLYGFTKFVIVVPSVAIKEGVHKTLRMTEDHFKGLYAGTPMNFFPYDSSKLGEVRNFATSSLIQVMIVTVGAINKKGTNKIYDTSEKTGGEAPIDLIRATQPVVILDEPQSVEGGLTGKGRDAIEAMSPLCTLRYSATHAEKHHMVYRLDAVDAYERKLVKQIEVASATVENAFNNPYLRFISASSKKGDVSAKVEVDVETATGVKRMEKTVYDGEDLAQTTKRAVYEGWSVGEIKAGKKAEQHLELRIPGQSLFLSQGGAQGDVDADELHKKMISRTIKEHFDKELRLRAQGIKVLTLFFIDSVAKYRAYDDDSNPIAGPYAVMFEEEFVRLAGHPDYKELFEGRDPRADVLDAHNGYFSVDRHGTWADTDEGPEDGRKAAEYAYNLIMKDKERLLSLDEPLRFIFSHSALKEGWDNPNVFQICSLRDIRSERERRQTIGRGLRLCVNQDGDRVHGFEVNTLTVIATEDYETFAEELQREIEENTGLRFGFIESHQFAAIPVHDADGAEVPLGVEKSEQLWAALKATGYIDAKGKVQDELRAALSAQDVAIPAEFEDQAPQIDAILRKYAGSLVIKDADQREVIKTRRKVLEGDDFKALWNQIKDKTTYRVEFDNEDLIKTCVKEMKDAPDIARTKLRWHTGVMTIGKGGVTAEETETTSPEALSEGNIPLPDLLTELQDRTQLKRSSILRIVTESGKLDDFERNPQAYIALAADVINRRKSLALVDGIKYERLGDGEFYAQSLFDEEELTGYVSNMLIGAKKCVYEHVVYDFGIERAFADALEKNTDVKAYVKLPGWFRIPTPLGTYNPDWALVINKNGEDRVYFVVETKGDLLELRDTEKAKIKCGEAHFAALREDGSEAQFKKGTTLDEVLT
jgi:type III restriction enzyme